MSFPTYSLICGRGGSMSITFKTHYLAIHNELKDSVENSIIPYTSICGVDEEHLNDGLSSLRRIHINLICSRIKSIESDNSKDAEEILLHLLSHTIKSNTTCDIPT
jgi:hypothetical protein